jgi:hypothetical protein
MRPTFLEVGADVLSHWNTLPCSPVNFATVADPDNEYEENRLAYLVENPIVADPKPIEIVCASA